MVLDVTGQDVPETGLVFDEGDRDMLMWPVPGSMVRVPWANVPTAQYIATVHDLDGVPHYADPRNALEKIVKRTGGKMKNLLLEVPESALGKDIEGIIRRPDGAVPAAGADPSRVLVRVVEDRPWSFLARR